MRGYCAVSQEIREKIIQGYISIVGTATQTNNGKFANSSLEDRIQPSSFEPSIDDHLFILDADTGAIIRPELHESIRKTLLRLPKRQRQKIEIDQGFELKKGFSYLLPLREVVKLKKGEYVLSSPKSSRGRLFLHTRFLSDFNPCFNEIDSNYLADEPLHLWLLMQPTQFNVIIHPGMTFNQLRFFTGTDAQLTDNEIRREIDTNKLLYLRNENSQLEVAHHIIRSGLQIHLELSGHNTQGIVGLRARNNPIPIDLNNKLVYNAEDYFEPLTAAENGELLIGRKDFFLLGSKEVLDMPPHLSSELDKHSAISISGSLHDAGFIDNGFQGDVVFEVRSGEMASMVLKDGMPMSKLRLFRTRKKPDKVYGEMIGSSYQGQVGPRISHNFRDFDYQYAARNYKKLDRHVLVQDRNILLRNRSQREGFEFIQEQKHELLHDISSGFFQSRYDCEHDEEVLQPIPYVLFFGHDHTIFSYVRAKNIQDYGDERLFGKYSLGVGGHIVTADGPDYLNGCLDREVNEEVIIDKKSLSPSLVGTIMAYEKPVDMVHFGLIYTIHVTETVRPKEVALISGRMMNIDELQKDKQNEWRYETWSKMLIPYLQEIYRMRT